MRKRRIACNAFLGILILVFIFSPIRFDKFSFYGQDVNGANLLIINTDTIWKKSDNLILDKNVIIDGGATLTIEKGATITFKGEPRIIYIFSGNIVAEGTQDEKITFQADQSDFSTYGIFFQDRTLSKESFFRYTKFTNGGFYPCVMYNDKSNNFLNTAYACPLGGAVEYYSGRVHIENSEFVDSFQGAVHANIYEYKRNNYYNGSYLEVVNSNFSGSKDKVASDISVSCDSGSCATKILMKNNWYGNDSGPSFGERVLGNRGYDGYRKSSLVVDPVVIIPGITGSMPSSVLAGKLVLDPVLHIYDNLIASFQKNGYEKDINLFDFPYEWRNSNVITANNLKNKIGDIKAESKISKVDIVAHSMGGLLTRQYIENTDYQNDIDQLITLGTPHRGSPKSYIKWEAGEGLEDFFDKVSGSVFTLEAHSLGYDNLQDYIQNRVISVKELLPDYNYLEKNGEMKDYPDGYPRNTFLEVLNNQDALSNLGKVNFINVIGNTETEKTIKKFRVTDSTVSGSWEHGMPENFYDYGTDRGIEYGKGDETVPLSSADGVVANKKIEIDSIHGDLPTKAQCYVIKELAGNDNCEYVSTFDRVKNILTLGVFSPVDIQVIAPDGKWAGKNIGGLDSNNEISGAYYSGFNTDNEFLTVPNPGDGEYKILTQGTGEGEYKIKIAKISEDEENPEKAVESTAEISGAAITGSQEELKIEIVGNEVIANRDKTPPTIDIISPENKTYQNNEIVEIKYDVSDNKSQSDKIIKEVNYDGQVINKSSIDLSLEHLGVHNIFIKATDEAGNYEEEKIEFTSNTDINSIISNVNHYYDLNLITTIGSRNYLRAKLRIIKSELQAINLLQKTKLSKPTKEKLLQIFKKMINLEISHIINQIQKDKNLAKTIDLGIRRLIIENLEYIKL